MQDTQPYANQADPEPMPPWAALRRSLMSAIRQRPALSKKPPLHSRRRSYRAAKQLSALAEEVRRTSSDAAAVQNQLHTLLTSASAAQRSGSHALETAADGGPGGPEAAHAALLALSPFVPRLLCDELAAAAPVLPSLAGGWRDFGSRTWHLSQR